MSTPDFPPTPGVLVFDQAGVMERLMDDQDLMRTLLAGFFEDVPTQIAALQANIDAQDRAGVEIKAHTIRGAASNLGGESLVQVAAEIEQAARGGDLARAGALMDALRTRLDAFQAAVAHLKPGGENHA